MNRWIWDPERGLRRESRNPAVANPKRHNMEETRIANDLRTTWDNGIPFQLKNKVENGGIQENSIIPGEELDSVGSNLLEGVSKNLFPDGPENTESVESSDFDETDQSSTREIIKRGIERREKRFTRTSISTLQKK